MMAPDVDQLMIFEHAVHAASHRDSPTTVDTDVTDIPSSSINYHRNNSTATTTSTMSDRQRSASAAVNRSAWQLPVDIYRLTDYDDEAYDYNDDDVDDYRLNDERLKTKADRLNASGTEGRSISLCSSHVCW